MIASSHILPPDTQAILLLCAGFGQSRQVEPLPLSLGEYNLIAQKLQQQGLRPGDLLSTRGKDWVLQEINGNLDPRRVVNLLERGAMLAFKVESWTSKGIWILGRSDENYPRRLKQKLKHLSPPILYGVGNQALLSRGGLAIVGSRNVDDEGIGYTERIAQKCAEQSIQIVSGGARGVDSAAMISAINAGGTSVGILADSLLKASVSIKYRDGIRQGRLVLVSPYDPSAGFNAGNAMNRNKFIYALADHALIVDSAYEKGGTWAGAKEELKRENHPPVWVRLDGKVSAGNEQLVKLGARAFPSEPWNQHIFKLLEDFQVLNTIDEHKSEQLDLLNSTDWQLSNSSNEPIHTQSVPEVSQLPKTAYDAVIPLLLHHLREPKGEKEIADVLDVGLAQARLWLKKAVQDSFIEKKKTKYVLNQSPQQLQLLK